MPNTRPMDDAITLTLPDGSQRTVAGVTYEICRRTRGKP